MSAFFRESSRTITAFLRRLTLGRVPTLFDAAYYQRIYPDAAASSLDPFLHYVLIGARRDYDPNADFDTLFYRSQVKSMRLDPLRHYLKIGAGDFLDPHPSFSTRAYVGRYLDVVAAKTNPLQHYREHGRPERRVANQSVLLPLIALTGVPSSDHWILPDSDRANIGLVLLRIAFDAPDAIRVERLCLSLCLNVQAVDGAVEAITRFSDGVQDMLSLDLGAGRQRGDRHPTLLLALDQCHMQPAAADGTRLVHYAQAVIWDLRPDIPLVLSIIAQGVLRF